MSGSSWDNPVFCAWVVLFDVDVTRAAYLDEVFGRLDDDERRAFERCVRWAMRAGPLSVETIDTCADVARGLA